MPQKKDIFDRIMAWRPLRPLQPFYKAHKEALLYLFFGGMTFLVSIASYQLFVEILAMDVLLGNCLSWVAAVAFAYVTNCIWVFAQKPQNVHQLLAQLGSFCAGRLATLAVEELILWGFVEQLHWNGLAVKTAAQVLVILLNYIISKLWVFKAHQPKSVEENEEQ